MSETTSIVVRDAAIGAAAAALVPAVIFGPGRWIREARQKKKARIALEAKRDQTLEDVAKMLGEIGGDVRCLYSIQAPQLEALEITLVALHGETLNGNVEEALTKVRKAKQTISDRLNDKVGCADIGEGAD